MIQNLKFKTYNNSSPIDSSCGEAQDYCNFVLFKPNWLPNNLRETSNKIRPESPHEESAHRSEYRDENRALSIKQFLYDWAPPAYDHPCLWRNAKISTQENTPLPTPYLIGNNYLWFGLDYRRKVSATINMLRTQIEITTLEGVFNDQEIAKIVDSMIPVNGDIKNVILAMSFAELMYHQRHQIPASDVPTSYFKHTRNKKFRCFPHTLLSLSTINIVFPGKWLIDLHPHFYPLINRDWLFNLCPKVEFKSTSIM